jgi:hypothetical protein
MGTEEQAMQALADCVGCPAGSAAERRQALEATLLPMVRCVLRTGRGHPRLVRWVQKALRAAPPHPGGPAAERDRAAPLLARLLCTVLLQQPRNWPEAGAARETLFGI